MAGGGTDGAVEVPPDSSGKLIDHSVVTTALGSSVYRQRFTFCDFSTDNCVPIGSTGSLPVQVQNSSIAVTQSGSWNIGITGSTAVVGSATPGDSFANPTTGLIDWALLGGWDPANSVWRRIQVDTGTGRLEVDPGVVVLGAGSAAVGSVSVSNFPATQAISAASLPLPANASQETGGNLATLAGGVTGSKYQIRALTSADVVAITGASTPGDAVANPTSAALVESLLEGWDATNTVWRRLQVDAATGRLEVDPGTVTVTGTVAATQSGTWTVQQGTPPWAQNSTQLAGSTLGAPSAYGTSPGAVTVPGVNAFITNTPSVAQSGSPWGVSGTLTSNQGTANTVANSWPVELTNGTNTTAVKAASTAAAATDPSAVVALSPNSPLPAGTNALGTVALGAGSAAVGTVTLGAGSATIGALTANQSVSLAQVNGVTTLTGAGAVGTGSARVAVGQDTTTIAGSAPGTAGTPSANVITVQGVASGTTLPASAPDTVVNFSGLAAVNAAAAITVSGTQSVGADVTGTFVATVVAEGSVDGTNWTLLTVVTPSGGAGPALTFASITGPVTVSLEPTAGMSQVRLRVSAFTSGSVGGQIRASSQPAAVTNVEVSGGTATANQGTANTATNGWPVKITDGTSIGAVKAASTAAVAADPSQVVALSPNSPLPAGSAVIGALTANQSVAQGTAAAASGAWTAKITDGTNVGAVKAASTAAAATDPSVVVAISPNSPLPAGSAAIGSVTQGSANTVANGWPVKITDGTNTGAVKAASTAPAATDPAQVVVLSPNYPAITPVVTATAAASKVLKAAAGNLYSVNATNQTTTAGFLVVINATTAPTTGSTITPLSCAPLPASGSASINYGQVPAAYSTGITAMLTSATTCFTFTSGTITGFISGLIQ
jgi:hypothetical protein